MFCGDCTPQNWLFEIDDNGTDPTIERDSNSSPTMNWTHVAGVYNAAARSLDIYVNGILDNGALSGTVPSSQFNSSLNPTIGVRPVLDSFFPGQIDDVRIYNRSLSGDEIKRLYNMGR